MKSQEYEEYKEVVVDCYVEYLICIPKLSELNMLGNFLCTDLVAQKKLQKIVDEMDEHKNCGLEKRKRLRELCAVAYHYAKEKKWIAEQEKYESLSCKIATLSSENYDTFYRRQFLDILDVSMQANVLESHTTRELEFTLDQIKCLQYICLVDLSKVENILPQIEYYVKYPFTSYMADMLLDQYPILVTNDAFYYFMKHVYMVRLAFLTTMQQSIDVEWMGQSSTITCTDEEYDDLYYFDPLEHQENSFQTLEELRDQWTKPHSGKSMLIS